MLRGGDALLRLLADAGLLAEIDLGLENLHRLEHHLGRNTRRSRAIAATTTTTAPTTRRRHEVVREPVERVAPELRLGHRHARLLVDVFRERPQAAERIEALHLLEDRAEGGQLAAIEVGLQVIQEV